MRPFAYARPATLAEATRLVAERGVPMGGGTDLIAVMKAGWSPATVVDLTGVASLGGWERAKGRGLRIGAVARLADLEADDRLARSLPIVRAALRDAATQQLRNAGTLGGNLLQANRCWYYRDPAIPCWHKGGKRCFAVEGDSRLHAILGDSPCHMVAPSDLAPALVACDAVAELRSTGRARRVPLASLYREPAEGARREHALRPGEILVAVRVPEAMLGRRAAFQKQMERKAWSFAVVSVAATARVRAGRLHDARVVLGGVAAIPWRVPAAEALLEGRAPDRAATDAAADVLLAGAVPMKDNAHKVALARVLVRRALASLVG